MRRSNRTVELPDDGSRVDRPDADVVANPVALVIAVRLSWAVCFVHLRLEGDEDLFLATTNVPFFHLRFAKSLFFF